MGLFSRKPRIPDPYIIVALDEHCQGPFVPGSQISGSIALQTPAQRHLEVGQASFFGHAMTASTRSEGSGNNNRTYYFRDDATVFRFEQTMLMNTTLAYDQIYSWPFQFQFPHTTGLVGASPYTGETTSSGIYSSASHPLPPSFGLSRTRNNYATIEYKIQASFKFADEKKPFIMELEPLNFLPHNPRPQNTPFAEFVKPAQQYSSSRLVGCEKSLGSSLRDKFSSQTPAVKVVMKTTVPPYVTTSGSFPIYACVEIDNFCNFPAIEIPMVNIKIKSLKLCQYTFYRAIRLQGTRERYREHQEMYEEVVPLNTVPEWRQVERQYGGSSKNSIYFPATFEARIPGATCPSFQTFNINHNFQLEFKLEADICEKNFDYKVVVPNVIVFPS